MNLSSIKNKAHWLLLLIFFIPFEVEVVPAWKIVVVNSDGKPEAGAGVTHWWQHYTLESNSNFEEKFTDSDGHAEFERRSLTTIPIVYGVRRFFLIFNIHASTGISSSIYARNQCYFGSVYYAKRRPLPKKIILDSEVLNDKCKRDGN